MLDLNIVLDVVERRPLFYDASVQVLSAVDGNDLTAFFPGHGVTTIHYLVKKYAGLGKANEVVDWLLANLAIAPSNGLLLKKARGSGIIDFEDAVLCVAAERMECQFIVTRNMNDFKNSPVRAILPDEFLNIFQRRN